MNKADVTPLIGRHFVAGTDNVARIQKLGEGGMRIVWKRKPSKEEVEEFTAFVESVIGPVNATICENRENEERLFRRWLKSHD